MSCRLPGDLGRGALRPLAVLLPVVLAGACPKSKPGREASGKGAPQGTVVAVRVVPKSGAAVHRLRLALRARWVARHAALGDPGRGGQDGLLLVYPRDRALGVSAATASVPVDVTLLDGSGRVLRVATSVSPGAAERVDVIPNLYRYAVVLRAGGAARAGLAPGARVEVSLPGAARGEGLLLPVTLETPSGRRVRVLAELAATPDEIQMGLMYRRRLPRRGGMLFAFPRPRVLYFWMRNTRIPLDMIFVDAQRVVTGVVHGAKPFDEHTVGVGRIPNQFVLEVNAGFARRHGIVAGSRALFRLPR